MSRLRASRKTELRVHREDLVNRKLRDIWTRQSLLFTALIWPICILSFTTQRIPDTADSLTEEEVVLLNSLNFLSLRSHCGRFRWEGWDGGVASGVVVGVWSSSSLG
jgi:hypothetical protein